MSNPFEALGWTQDQNDQAAEAIAKPSVPRKDPRVCLCGHSARAHATQGLDAESAQEYRERGLERCQVARMSCPCRGFVEVLQTEDVRAFTFKTSGPDTDHALTKGIKKLQGRDNTFEWSNLEKTACTRCGESSGQRHLVAMTNQGRIATYPAPNNLFLCHEHFIEMGGARA
jgi:hypothetical protein